MRSVATAYGRELEKLAQASRDSGETTEAPTTYFLLRNFDSDVATLRNDSDLGMRAAPLQTEIHAGARQFQVVDPDFLQEFRQLRIVEADLALGAVHLQSQTGLQQRDGTTLAQACGAQATG